MNNEHHKLTKSLKEYYECNKKTMHPVFYFNLTVIMDVYLTTWNTLFN